MNKNLKNSLILSGLLGILTAGCTTAKVNEIEGKVTVRMGITDEYNQDNKSLMYCGMNDRDGVFFLSNPGSQSAVPITYSTASKTFHYRENDYNLLKVTPDSLVISYQKKK
jgi:hypothetical protein